MSITFNQARERNEGLPYSELPYSRRKMTMVFLVTCENVIDVCAVCQTPCLYMMGTPCFIIFTFTGRSKSNFSLEICVWNTLFIM